MIGGDEVATVGRQARLGALSSVQNVGQGEQATLVGAHTKALIGTENADFERIRLSVLREIFNHHAVGLRSEGDVGRGKTFTIDVHLKVFQTSHREAHPAIGSILHRELQQVHGTGSGRGGRERTGKELPILSQVEMQRRVEQTTGCEGPLLCVDAVEQYGPRHVERTGIAKRFHLNVFGGCHSRHREGQGEEKLFFHFFVKG